MKTAPEDNAALAKVNELIRDIRIAMLTTQTPDGALRSRPMATQGGVDERGELWFFTADDSGKAHEIAQEHHVNVSYAEPKDQRYVSISGRGVIVRDRERAQRLWTAALKEWFPAGLDDPRLALLRVRVEAAEYWDAGTSRMVTSLLKMVAQAAMAGATSRDTGSHGTVKVAQGR